MNSWSSQLRILRRYHGLKQAVLAEMLGVDQATVSRWENARQEPDLGRRRRLRDLVRCFSSKVEVDIRALMASPIADRSLMDDTFNLRDMSAATLLPAGVRREDLLGQRVRSMCNNPEYERQILAHQDVLRSGEFVSYRSVFYSRPFSSWVETHAVPVFLSGRVYSLNDRRFIPKPDPAKQLFHIVLLE